MRKLAGCEVVASCPAVYELDTGKLLIVGKAASALQVSTVDVGKDEFAIVIDGLLVEKALDNLAVMRQDALLKEKPEWPTE